MLSGLIIIEITFSSSSNRSFFIDLLFFQLFLNENSLIVSKIWLQNLHRILFFFHTILSNLNFSQFYEKKTSNFGEKLFSDVNKLENFEESHKVPYNFPYPDRNRV